MALSIPTSALIRAGLEEDTQTQTLSDEHTMKNSPQKRKSMYKWLKNNEWFGKAEAVAKNPPVR